MAAILTVLDFLAVLAVIVTVSRNVWTGQQSRLLAGLIVAAMLIFGMVSLSAASGLAIPYSPGQYGLDSLPTAASSGPSSNQIVLLIFLIAIGAVAWVGWKQTAA